MESQLERSGSLLLLSQGISTKFNAKLECERIMQASHRAATAQIVSEFKVSDATIPRKIPRDCA